MASTAKKKYYEGKGSRKRASARVRIYEGNETSVVNGVPLEDFFKDFERDMEHVKRPLVVSGLVDKLYFSAKVQGGGRTGQNDAIVMGLAYAILAYDDSHRPTLSKEGLLTRDMREKERKKYFLIKARKRPQFSKR